MSRMLTFVLSATVRNVLPSLYLPGFQSRYCVPFNTPGPATTGTSGNRSSTGGRSPAATIRASIGASE